VGKVRQGTGRFLYCSYLKMRTLILHNIISSNTVYKLKSYIKRHSKDLGEVLVVFCAETESNRKWKLNEKISFDYKILKGRKFEFAGKDLFTYFYNPEIFKLLREYNPDKIIISGWDQFAYQVAFVWGWLHRKRLTLWSGSTVNEKSWRRTVTLLLVKLFVWMCRDYIAYGKRSKEYLVSLGANPRKIEVFLNDVDKEYFINESKKWKEKEDRTKVKLGLTKKHHFLFVGQFIERKGVADLVESFKLFSRIDSDWGLVLVGYGNQESAIKDCVRKNNIDGVKFLGAIEQYNLPKIYTACDVLVLPSREEVWGLVVNEALYCGLKVLVSDKCGCGPELVKEGQNGYIFEAGNKKDLLRKMVMVEGLITKDEGKPPFFSIITCTLNSAKYLPKNIESVRKQTFKGYEHIFIDGYSKDGTTDFIKKYLLRHKNRIFLFEASPRGISNAMNIGINKSKGMYILILHSDDSLYDKEVLKDIYNYLVEQPGLDWIYGKINVIEESGRCVGQYPLRKIYRFFPGYFLKYYNIIPHQAVFMCRSVFDRFGGFDESLSSTMDVDYWLRVGFKTRWHFLDRVVSNFMIRKGAQSSGLSRREENIKNSFKVRRRYLNLFEMQIFKIVKGIVDYYNKTYR
jgi:glycosyltransferase involved in cell wall biosynthesis